MSIYIDAFGGDHAPDAVITGAVLARQAYQQDLVLIGDETKIQQSFARLQLPTEGISIVHAPGVISPEEEPAMAVRKKKDASIVVGASMLKKDSSSVFVTAGSTGAAVAAGLFVAGRIKGVSRPALAVELPFKRPLLLIDSGANAEVKVENLVQFAKIGRIYAKEVMNVQDPLVGLLNIGAEEEKGSALYKQTNQALAEEDDLHFIGNVEARDIPDGVCDVLVCDGFSGNIVLKLTEGMAAFFKGVLKDVFHKNAKTKIGAALLKDDFKQKFAEFDYTKAGGAPLLGINGTIIKAHGSSDAEAIKNAVRQAILYAQRRVDEKIKKTIL